MAEKERADCRSLLQRVLVSDRRLAGGCGQLADAVVRCSRRHAATLVLLREKDLDDGTLLDLARRLRRELSVPCMLAHRADLAAAAGCAGVHLGWNSGTVEAARRELPRDSLVGVSVHAVGEGLRRAAEKPDYLVLGPVRPTPSKQGLVKPVGFAALKELALQVTIPVVGIGGLELADAERISATGAAGLAAIRAFLEEPAGDSG